MHVANKDSTLQTKTRVKYDFFERETISILLMLLLDLSQSKVNYNIGE